jgi:hypothetical protein
VTTPHCGLLFNFTHLDNVRAILGQASLLCDTRVRSEGLLKTEAGHQGIKERRRTRPVTCDPGGVVADYVPFYFAARSPMMLKLRSGQVPTFTSDHRDLVYFLTTVDRILESGIPFVISDRNAAVAVADFSNDVTVLGDLTQTLPASTFVDWPLMNQTYWNNTAEYPDRMERRMAEFLVHDNVPLDLVTGIAVHSENQRAKMEHLFEDAGRPVGIELRPDWYYA